MRGGNPEENIKTERRKRRKRRLYLYTCEDTLGLDVWDKFKSPKTNSNL